MTVSHALKRLVERQRFILAEHLTGAVEEGGEESLHRCRVSTRRLRAVLSLCRNDMLWSSARAAGRRARVLGQMLGPVRELDVALELLAELAGHGLVKPAAVGRIRQRIREERTRQRRRLTGKLDRSTRRKVGQAIEDVTDTMTGIGTDREWVKELARHFTRRAGRLRRLVRAAGSLYVSERVHAVRIEAKKLRYMFEIASETGEAESLSSVTHLKKVQQVLGRLHDLEVLQDLMRSIERPTETHQMWFRQLESFDDEIEGECRRLHSYFVAEQQEILRVCENADEFADQIFKGTGKELLKTRRRPIKMTLEIPGEIPVSRQH